MPDKIEDLNAFRNAIDLVVEVYDVTSRFPRCESYGLTSQLRRAAVSIAAQIAEGQGRLSFGEWRQLLSQARGSLYEVEAEVIAAARLSIIDEATHERLRRACKRVGGPLAGIIRYVQSRERLAKQPTGNRSQATGNSAK